MSENPDFDNLIDKEKTALCGVASVIFHNMQHPPEGGYPSPDNTRKWLINGLVAMYLSGKSGDIAKMIEKSSPSKN